MNKCNFHKQNDAKKICANCGKSFCDECAKQTDYTGRCIACELKHQKAFAKVCRQKQVSLLSTFVASFVGAVIFFVFHLVFNDFKTVGVAGACLLGIVAILFGVLSVDNGFKIKKAKSILKKLQDYSDCQKNDD